MLDAFRDALSFAFVDCEATWSRLADVPQADCLAVSERLSACRCRRLALDGEDLTRAALVDLAASAGRPYARAVLLAAVDYAHRTGGCAAQGTAIHELVAQRRPAAEPAELSALLERLRLSIWRGRRARRWSPRSRRAAAYVNVSDGSGHVRHRSATASGSKQTEHTNGQRTSQLALLWAGQASHGRSCQAPMPM
ncbi:hypothetical protein AB0G77_39795 [Streptomyces hygroscopicus]|uniref:hypothetical protein n=1 Tax=Streptomyces hygroscopicus TaxID=1912 RepID=UPI0033DFD544